MTRIVTAARSSSNAIRSHTHPILEEGNLSFPSGTYAVAFEDGPDRSSFHLEHQIEGAPLIARLLDEGKAKYVCTVSSPISSYRATHISREPKHEIRWDREELGEPPLFTPMIVSTADHSLELDQARDGVHAIWDGQPIQLLKGSRLALGPVIQLRSSILSLLSFRRNPDLKPGSFCVSAETEPFRFLVELSPDLHQFLRYSNKDPNRHNIITHIVTACLALLQRDFNKDDDDEGWKSHRNLQAFADFLKDKDQPHWGDEEFRPEQVATELYPHVLPPNEEESEE